MGEFFGSFGALILGFLAFAQFWVKIVWEKYCRKGKIEYYETDTIAIGYDHSGPTLYLKGTMRTLNKDVFIRTIDLLVVREKDKAQHIFKWAAFLSPRIAVSGSPPAPMEIPSGFLISPNSPHQFNIVFNDRDLFKDISPLLNEYYSEWNKTTGELNKIWPPLIGISPTPTQVARQLEVIENFRNSKIHVDTFTALDRKCYWEPGDYRLTVNVTASKPDIDFTWKYRFSISEADSKNLKLNAVTILEQPVANYRRVQNYPYNFAFSEYKKPENIN
jgi:hypothetical protein